MVTYTFYGIIQVYKLSPLNWRNNKKNSSKGKKDTAKSIPQANFLMMQIRL